jgi:CBS domain-containing protein
MRNSAYAMTVQDVMSRDVVTAYADESLRECIQRMIDNRVASLPVLGKHEECVGIVSSSDVLEITREIDEDLSDLEGADVVASRWLIERLSAETGDRRVSEVMSQDVLTVRTDTRLSKAAREMLRNGVHRLPVVDRQDRVVGIVSTTDILAAFVDADPEKLDRTSNHST